MKIGIEIHVALSSTKTKMYCGCPNPQSLKTDAEPNTMVCETCLGFPGSKPRVNKAAIDSAIKIAIALDCRLQSDMFFSRKGYFYPDLPKNFQISQYEIPLAVKGHLEINSDNKKKNIIIRRVHLEEDPGKIIHVGGDITKAEYILIDYNRSGVPLCEIVTEPDFSTPKEVRVFLEKLSGMLEYLGIYDSTREGSMRIDANVSIKDKQIDDRRSSYGSRVEVKNISGFKDVERALNYEIIRQNNLLKRGSAIVRETRAWDSDAGVTRSLRIKEEEEEYGYIFEGDLPRITIAKEKGAEIEKLMPEFAEQKITKYSRIGVSRELAEAIVAEQDLAEMFERVIGETDSQLAAKWFAGEIKKTLNFRNLRIKDTKLMKEHLIDLLKKVQDKTVTEKTAEMMLREMVVAARPEDVMKASGLGRIHDETVLGQIIERVVNENPKAVLDYKSGRQEAFNFIVGNAMKKTQGRGDPETIRRLVREFLK